MHLVKNYCSYAQALQLYHLGIRKAVDTGDLRFIYAPIPSDIIYLAVMRTHKGQGDFILSQRHHIVFTIKAIHDEQLTKAGNHIAAFSFIELAYILAWLSENKEDWEVSEALADKYDYKETVFDLINADVAADILLEALTTKLVSPEEVNLLLVEADKK
jgi:hypothetical protein